MVKMLQQQNVFYLTQWAPVSLEIPTLMVVMIQKDTNFEDHQKGANCDQNNAKKSGNLLYTSLDGCDYANCYDAKIVMI